MQQYFSIDHVILVNPFTPLLLVYCIIVVSTRSVMIFIVNHDTKLAVKASILFIVEQSSHLLLTKV